MRFRVTAGIHKEGEQTFKKGQVVESDSDLAAKFRGKFARLDLPAEESDPAPPPVQAKPKTIADLEDEPEADGRPEDGAEVEAEAGAEVETEDGPEEASRPKKVKKVKKPRA